MTEIPSILSSQAGASSDHRARARTSRWHRTPHISQSRSGGPGLGERLEHLCPARAPCPARSREGRRLLELLEQAKAGPDLLRRVEEQLAAPETEGEGPEHARDGAPPALTGWEDLWAGMTLEERRALLRLAVGECTWDGQALHFYSPFAPPEDVALSVEAHSRL